MEENKPAVSRRGLLRRAGTVAAGVGAAGAATAAFGSPAHAADNDPIVVGGEFTGSTTTLTSNSATAAALKLGNTGNAASLELMPVTLNEDESSPVSPDSVPAGTTYVDTFGDVHVIGAGSGTSPHYDLMLYSPTWASMPIPMPPARIVSTYPGDAAWGRDLIVPGSATYDSSGRVIPKNGSGPDLVIDLSTFILATNFPAAIQGNLTIGSATRKGYASLWDEGSWPGSSSLNFVQSVWTENFTQTLIGSDQRIRLKLSAPGIFVFDVFGFVVADPYSQFGPGITANTNAAQAFAKMKRSLHARRVPSR